MNGCRIRKEQKASVGGAAVLFHTVEGHRLDGEHGNFQVVCNTLDGGTFAVKGLFPDMQWRTLATGVAATAVALIPDTYVIEALAVEFAGLGGAAAPVVHVSMSGRTLRYSS